MFIIFGWGFRTRRVVGPLWWNQCPTCGNQSLWHLVRVLRWFTLFFVPIFPYSTTYAVMCPVCSRGFVPKGEQLNQLRALAQANSAAQSGQVTSVPAPPVPAPQVPAPAPPAPAFSGAPVPASPMLAPTVPASLAPAPPAPTYSFPGAPDASKASDSRGFVTAVKWGALAIVVLIVLIVAVGMIWQPGSADPAGTYTFKSGNAQYSSVVLTLSPNKTWAMTGPPTPRSWEAGPGSRTGRTIASSGSTGSPTAVPGRSPTTATPARSRSGT